MCQAPNNLFPESASLQLTPALSEDCNVDPRWPYFLAGEMGRRAIHEFKMGFRWLTKWRAGEMSMTEEGAAWGLIRVPGDLGGAKEEVVLEVVGAARVEVGPAEWEGWQVPWEQWELTTREKGSEGCKRSLQHPVVQPKAVAFTVHISRSGHGAVRWKKVFDGNSTFHSCDKG